MGIGAAFRRHQAVRRHAWPRGSTLRHHDGQPMPSQNAIYRGRPPNLSCLIKPCTELVRSEAYKCQTYNLYDQVLFEEVTNEVKLRGHVGTFETGAREAMDHALGAAVGRWRTGGAQVLGVDFAIVVERV